MNKRKYFGTDGIRGRVGSQFINAEFMMKLGWAVGTVLIKEEDATVLIGHDTRVSSGMLESALQSGLSAAGVNVELLGALPTPAIAHLTHSLRASAGISISASHNPYDDNGVKFFDWQGMKLSDEMEAAIEEQLNQPMQTLESTDIGKVKRLIDAGGRYVEFCKSIFPSQLSLNGLKFVLDCANGATYDVAPKVFHELGAEIIVINNKPNGKNINKKSGAMDVTSLQAAVMKHKADAGLAFDGDGDRLMMVDDQGEIVDGDEILCILAKDRSTGLGSRAGIVGTVMSNLGLEQSLVSAGIAFERTSVGDRYVLETLLEKGWALGGEASGHIVDLDYTTTGDGVITGLQVLRIMRVTEKSLHELKQAMTKCPQVLINVPIKEKIDIGSYPEISKAIVQAEKQLKGEGRVLLRPSGTEPLIRVMVEGNNKQAVQNIAEFLASVVEKCI